MSYMKAGKGAATAGAVKLGFEDKIALVVGSLSPKRVQAHKQLLLEKALGRGYRGAKWETKRVSSYNLDFVYLSYDAPEMPVRIKERARRVSRLPGVRLEVDYFDQDPILYAVGGYWFWKKRVPIGAWGTGDPQLDNF